jgi:hypothetical protein
MAAEDPRLGTQIGANDLLFVREGEEIGSWKEMIQAFCFVVKEFDFFNQLNFEEKGRARRLAGPQARGLLFEWVLSLP